MRNDYASELRKQLERFKITFKDDFEPCGTKVLRDPEYANLWRKKQFRPNTPQWPYDKRPEIHSHSRQVLYFLILLL